MTTEKKLTPKERRFVDAYTGSAAGNGTVAVLAAGYTKNRKSAAQIASRLLRKVNIQAAIQARADRDTARSILTADQRDEILSGIADAPTQDAHARIRAIAELNKCGGRHSIKHVIAGKLTLEQVLTESRK